MPIMGGGGGGAAFNGGTITQELVVDTGSGTGQALELQGSRTSEHDVFRIDYPHQIVLIDSDGVATLSSDENMAVTIRGTSDSGASVTATNSPTGAQATINASMSGGQMAVTDATGLTPAVVGNWLGLFVAVNAAPPDVNVNNGMVGVWFDATNGASKLMLKGKSLNGTVVTAAIALS